MWLRIATSKKCTDAIDNYGQKAHTRDMTETKGQTVKTATRVKFHEARRHFEAGGSVLVSEYGHEMTRPVTESTTTHSRETIGWDELADMVREWSSRYPNQRYYIVTENAS